MAESAKGELQPKTVQEIAQTNNGVVPEKYLHKNGYPQPQVDSVPLMEDVVVDFSLFSLSPSSPAEEAELGKVRFALSTWGCFQAINHGMTSSFLDEVRQVAKQFFAMPKKEKLKYSRRVDEWEGYGNDTIVSEHQTLDWTDRLYLSVYPKHRRKLKFWPNNPPAFKEVINEYAMKLRTMFEVLLKAMARSLNLDENCFLEEHGDLQMDTRFNFYPQCPNPESVLGIKPHADGTTFTVLLQDNEVEGLQVLKDGKWFRVPTIPEALFVNVGDLVEIISNGMLKSPVHRAVTSPNSERISIATFYFPNPDREVGPVAELFTADRPQKYKKVKKYEEIFFQYYQLGQRPLDAVKI